MTRVMLVFAMVLAACGQSNAPQAPASRPDMAQRMALPHSHENTSGNECFVAAAEAFEGLIERASAATAADLARQSASTAAQARSCQPLLSPRQSATMDNVLGRIGQFEMTHDRLALASAAVEGYRTFVTAETRPVGGTPIEVSLLDYAGFRYQADARAVAPLWSDMRQALDIADEQWRAVSPRVSDDRLKARFSADLAELRGALEAADQRRGQSAVVRELNDVDALESYFSHRARASD